MNAICLEEEAMGSRAWIVCGALLAGLAVAASAYGAHGVKGSVDTQRLDDYETAVRNHMIHAVALIFVGLVGRGAKSSWVVHFAGAAFLLGILLFCGGLYGFALSNNRGFVSVAPAGGISFMVGWVALAIAGWRARV
jgi:uncharacterized membrane protein YgdD (TMEM256/DUF423 family)